MELKASSRQLAGGAHRTLPEVGAEHLCQPSGLHKLRVPPARGSYPAPQGGSQSQGILGRLGRRNSLPDALFLGGNSSARERRVAGRLPCLEYHLCWVRECIGCLVGQHCPIPSIEEMKGVEIKYSAHSRFMEWRKEKEARDSFQDSSLAV